MVRYDSEKYLTQVEGDNLQWVFLGKSSRNLNHLRQECAPNLSQFQPHYLKEVGFKVRLSVPPEAAPSNKLQSPDDFFVNFTHFYTPMLSLPLLMKNHSLFCDRRLFFPEHSYLISAAWRCSLVEKLLVK